MYCAIYWRKKLGGKIRFNLLKGSNSNAEAKEKFKDLNYVQDNLVVTKL